MAYSYTYAEAQARGWITPAQAQAFQAAANNSPLSKAVKNSAEISLDRANVGGRPSTSDLPKTSVKPRPPTVRKNDAEGQEQAHLMSWFRTAYPEFCELLIHIPNGGSRKNAFEGWRLKQQGVRAGVSDLFLPVARGGFIGLWIEFKAAPPFDAAVSDSQESWLSLMRGQGHQACVCKGVQAAVDVLRAYLATSQTKINVLNP